MEQLAALRPKAEEADGLDTAATVDTTA
jgi:hypothetical protein